MSEWISIAEQLPAFTKQYNESIVNGVRCHGYEKSDRCFVVVNGSVTDSVLIHNMETDDHYWSMLTGGVTHWMPIPEPPVI